MVVIGLINAPPRLRGKLSNLLLEVQAGLYVGELAAKSREKLWETVCEHIEGGSACMAWPDSDNAAGVDFRTIGPGRRQAVLLDGIRFVDFPRLVSEEKKLVESGQSKIPIRIKDLREVSSPRQRG